MLKQSYDLRKCLCLGAVAILSKMGAGRLPNGVDGLMKPLPASWLALKRVPAKEPEQAVMSQSRPPVSSDGMDRIAVL